MTDMPPSPAPGEPVVERTDMRAEIDAVAAAPSPCRQCGDTSPPEADGTCPACGAARPAARDHIEMRLGAAAAVSDRGLRRRRNEDAVDLGRRVDAEGETWVAVVCDGVASARRGDEASLVAVGAAVEAALRAAEHATAGDERGDDGRGEIDTPSHGIPAPGREDDTPSHGLPVVDSAGDLVVIAEAASEAAAGAAEGLGHGGGDSPACTYVAAVVRGGDAIVSWVGDSRAYWLAGDGSSRLLSTDDSWAEEIAAAGIMSRDEAGRDRRAHELTRWLGQDSPGGPARARRVRLGVPGLLLLCSDGLWNHVPDAAILSRLAAQGYTDGDDAGTHQATIAARALLAAALDDGGHDNTTIALLPVTPPSADPDDPAAAERPSITVDGGGEARTGPIPLDEAPDPHGAAR